MPGILDFLPYFLNLQHFLNKSRIPYIYGTIHTSHTGTIHTSHTQNNYTKTT
ncbi:MAG: hypothetical protein SPH02_00535 [Campylobacter sp.]|nr:hypothetical protein [Campylobacter sp.]